ncbi:MAG TPA: M1 family metallopeptidase, partial [Chitinophagales bacterium]
MKNLSLFFLTILLFASACKTSKNTTFNLKAPVTELPEVDIIESRTNLYRASATKVNDLIHVDLKVKFDYEKQQLNGIAELTLQPHFFATKELVLDAKNFIFHKVVLLENGDEENLLYTYDTAQIKIDLGKEFPAGKPYKILINYTAKPNEKRIGGSEAIKSDKGLFFINPLGKEKNKPTQIWTQGETESNSGWFPCIDKPNQKMTDQIEMTVDTQYVTLSNGLLVSSSNNNDGTRTDTWKMDLPHAPYLVMMAIGKYAIVKDKWRDKEVNYYVEPEFADVAKDIFGNTPEMMETFSKELGVDYAWQKYAQITARDYVSGAMENTSATLHGDFLQRTKRQLIDEKREDIIAHELFHQWFGDLVTCESWSNIPLNESFATYGEYLWNEHKYGNFYADWKQYAQAQAYFRESQFKNVDLIRYYYRNREDMFDRHSYSKGGAILKMLRAYVGDSAFFKSLNLYLKTNQFKSVEVHNLRLAFEEVTGRDMNTFF